MIVIAIITLLAALLLPALQKARALAKRITCVSNLKNISVGLGLYASDFKDYFPARTGNLIPAGTVFKNSMRLGGKWYSSSGNGGAWSDYWDSMLVYLYFRNDAKILYCPSDPGGEQPGNGNTLSTRGWGVSLCDYPGWRGPSYGVQYVHAYFGLTYYGAYGSSTFYRGFTLDQIQRYRRGNLMLIADWQKPYASIFYSQANSDRYVNIYLNGSSHGKVMNFIGPDLSVRNKGMAEISSSDEYWMPNNLP
ncbi:MAG: hypothetical protein A2X49_16585 [Lentisphaerae bacterium GWF2_52_8]|nr:MAG: hypothetical protein A2X49_16585 [Lentisphaerae bacterium GWF2_52_8]